MAQEEKELMKDCKTMCVFFKDGQIAFITWVHRMITHPHEMEVSLRDGLGTKREGRQQMLLYSS